MIACRQARQVSAIGAESRKIDACQTALTLLPVVTTPPPLYSVAIDDMLGPYPADDFVISTGRDSKNAVLPQALWYFQDEVIAVAKAGHARAGFTPGVTAAQDVAVWADTHAPGLPQEYPPLIWVAAPDVIHGARLNADASRLIAGGDSRTFDVVPKIPLNRSYYDASSVAYFAARTLTMRGTALDDRFVARTLWPDDFRLDPSAPPRDIAATPRAFRRLVREEPRGGAQSPFAASTLWERTPGARTWRDRSVLAIMLNGAQGDDDEAHGGHFALVTGRVGGDGAMGSWLANNFYTLDSFSEKGIVAAPTPLDNYLADLNSGQAWYRPSYLLVAVLANDRVSTFVQSALDRTYNQLYRHQLVYQHATMNCASISVDAMRAMGWNVPARGATGRLLAAISLPYFAVQERSLDKAVQTYDYLTEDRTRLFPAAAFEDSGADLLRLARGRRRPRDAFERMLAEDLDALVFLRVPQIPSSRAWGDYPIVTAWEYTARLPSDPEALQIVPVPPRPFPDHLRDPDLLPPADRRGERALAVWAVLSVVGIPWLLWRWWQGRRQ
jgi:hypothetical protein